ncbi:MAG TPA: Smr/MutS family protein [Polyangiaceae bacterium]
MTSHSKREKAALDLEWALLLDRIAGRTVSESGAARVRALAPASTIEEARERGNLTRDALELAEEGARMPVVALPGFDELLDRLARNGVATGREFADLRRLLEAARALRAFAGAHAESRPLLARTIFTAPALDRLLAEIDQAVDEAGDVLDRASPELAKARKKARDARRELLARLGELLNRYGDVLRDRYYTERDGRYVLPVRSDAPFRVDGIVLGSSASGGTLYVEPREVTEIGNRMRMAEAEVERESARVLGAMSITARVHVEALKAAAEATTVADVLTALASFGTSFEATALSIDGDLALDLRAMRHPLLLGGASPVVPSDIRLSGGRGLVISGPNAGGKTVALKCLGLAVWMVRAGIPVPADGESRVGFFEPVLTDIGDEQSLAQSLSTFSAHVARLASYVADAGPGTLVLVDEVAAGTDPDEGAALAAAVLEALVTAGAAIATTTHYERLKQLAVRDPRFENASVGFDFETMSPTFRLTLGIPGASSALAVALRYGMPKDIVARAEALLPEENLRRDALLGEIEIDRARAEADRREAEGFLREQEQLRNNLDAEVRRAREQERARLAREGHELTTAVRQARAQLRDATDRLKKGDGSNKNDLRDIERAVNTSAGEVAVGGRIETALRGEQDDGRLKAADVVPGLTVFVPKLRTHAQILEAPVRGQVRIAAGAMKLTLRLDELSPAKSAGKPAKKPKVKAMPARTDATPVRVESNTCDIRGMRVEEAIDRVDTFVDRLLADGEPAGFVLHGHGTGALKVAIRAHLGAHPCVATSRTADDDQGGDAFTVLWTAG